MKKCRKLLLWLIPCCVLIFVSQISINACKISNNYDNVGLTEVGENSEGITTNFTAEFLKKKESLRSISYISNNLAGTLTPGSDGYAVVFVNAGIDKISRVIFTLTVYNYAGGLVASKTDTLTNLKVGSTSYIWMIPKSDSIYETVYLEGTGYDGGEILVFSSNTIRYNFAGGKYGTMQALGGQKHHMPSSYALTSTGVLSTYNGSCIRMITADHYQTASYGSSSTAVAFRTKETIQIKNGKFLAAQQLGISNIQGLFGKKYDKAINQMVSYTKGLGFTK